MMNVKLVGKRFDPGSPVALSWARAALSTGMAFAATLAVAQAVPASKSGVPQAPTSQAPPSAAALPAAQDKRTFQNTNVAAKPYNDIYTAPQYPSTRPVQKQFSITYLYNYAQSDYTPPVPLPTIGKAAQSFNTPENSLIAMLSSARRNSLKDWLACWDTPSQADFAARDKAQPGALAKIFAFYKGLSALRLALRDRVDTVNYIVLDVAAQDVKNPTVGQSAPDVLVFENGRWMSSSQFSSGDLLLKLAFGLPGQSATETFDLRPVDKGTAAVNHAQEAFLSKHAQSQKVTETVE